MSTYRAANSKLILVSCTIIIALAASSLVFAKESNASSVDELVLPSHVVNRFVMDSEAAGFSYEVLVGVPPEGVPADQPLPLMVVLDGYLLGLTAIETARLMGGVGELEPIIIAAVSPVGGFAAANTRRLRDFSADPGRDVSDDPMMQMFLPRFEAMGMDIEDAIGGSDHFRRFLEDELLPKLLATRNIDQNRLGIMGHSAGGSFLIETLLKADTPFRDYVIGEAGTFLMFGTGEALVKRAAAAATIPAKRVFYADSSDTREHASQLMAEADALLQQIRQDVGVPVESRTYQNETHTSMVPILIKDGLLHLYGTGRRYSDMLPKPSKAE